MSKSIIQMQGEQECFLCKTTLHLEKHHIMMGVRFREKADRFGLWVWLCPEHHRGRFGPHHNRNIDLDLKGMAQSCFEETHSREDWMKEFGRNYLKR